MAATTTDESACGEIARAILGRDAGGASVAELRDILNSAGVAGATPVGRGFLVGAAVLIGVEGLHLLVAELAADGRGLDQFVMDLHRAWARPD